MKAFLFIITFLVVLTTAIICLKPQVHKTVNIVYTDFAVVNQTNEEIRKVNVVNNNVTTNKAVTTVNPVQTNVETRTINTITQTTQPNTAVQHKTQQAKKTTSQPVKTIEKKVAQQKPTKTTTVQTTKPAQKNIQMREIDWEPWRVKIGTTLFSNIYQQLKSTVPTGTQYEYSFNVDNNKKISNIKVSIKSTPDKIMAEKGVHIIIIGIMNLNSKSVLTYPAGADGVTTAPMKAIITVREG